MIQRLLLAGLLATALVSCGPEDPSDPLSRNESALNVSYNCGTWQDTGYVNGNPFTLTLVTVDGHPMQIDTANAFLTMEAAANAAGITLSINDGFRTPAQQQYYYNCYINCNCNSCSEAAAPGYSNHQSGHAVDINMPQSVLNWMNAHAGAYGFRRTVASETWHWEWWGGGSPQTYCSVLPPDGYYCGGHGVSGDASTLYRVSGGALSTVQACVGWCATTASGDFCAPLHHQRTQADINGDGKADVCGRAAVGMACWPSDGSGFPVQLPGPPLSDAEGWGVPTYYGSIRYADVNGDGKADICARGGPGFSCWLSNGSSFATSTTGPGLADPQGFAAPQYGTTLQMADVNGDGKADVCVRTATEFTCWLSDGAHFGTEVHGPPLSDAEGWAVATYYTSIQMADVNGDGKADVCARGGPGFACWLSNGTAFATSIPGPGLADAQGFAAAKYGSTLQMADVNGDGKADVCVRQSTEFTCWLSNGAGFPTEVHGPPLSDALGWSLPQYYSSIQMADVNGDGKADVCARGSAGVSCWLSNGAAFPTQISGPALSDANGWDDPSNGATLQLADVNGDGKADVCARANAGWDCWLSTGTGFTTQWSNSPPVSDAAGWGHPLYFSTLTLVGSTGRRIPTTTTTSTTTSTSTSTTGTSGETATTSTTGTSGGASTSGGTSGSTSGSTGFDGSTSSSGSTSTSGTTVAPVAAATSSGCGCNAGSGQPLWAMLFGLLFSLRGMRRRRA